MPSDNISKKKQKALSFRKAKDERAAEKAEKAQRKAQNPPSNTDSVSILEEKSHTQEPLQSSATPQKTSPNPSKRTSEPSEDQEQPKKRKTRRGKKGKGVNNGAGPRYILFIGNLPYDTTQAELEQHFKKCHMDRIRVRREKGIAFLEFDNDNSNIKAKMDLALGMHHSMFRNRKINVELTAGGGGNSEARVTKLKEKNDKLGEERRSRAKKLEAKKIETKAEKEKNDDKSVGGMHPARAALLSQQ